MVTLQDLLVCLGLTGLAACWLGLSGRRHDGTIHQISYEDKGSREEVEVFFFVRCPLMIG